ncbi:MAG: BlaI/MecI/CopY family transcriptional regulator [Candidatus Aenigmarchaeota archaeon]|nr:BlaI/MecI/CopY family transcriptional regulator [Candidatus Aenigmarchaeota archaeon]
MVKVNKFRLDKKGMQTLLSPLETDALLLLWKLDKARVRDLHSSLKRNRKVAITSVAVIMDRLHQKGIVSRTIEKGRGGGHYIYCPKTSQNEFKESVIDNTVNKLMNTFGSVAANYFYKRFSGRKK